MSNILKHTHTHAQNDVYTFPTLYILIECLLVEPILYSERYSVSEVLLEVSYENSGFGHDFGIENAGQTAKARVVVVIVRRNTRPAIHHHTYQLQVVEKAPLETRNTSSTLKLNTDTRRVWRKKK